MIVEHNIPNARYVVPARQGVYRTFDTYRTSVMFFPSKKNRGYMVSVSPINSVVSVKASPRPIPRDAAWPFRKTIPWTA